MKYLIGLLLFTLSFNSVGQDKDSFLVAWENIQQNSEVVESFEKLSDKKYHIKFTTLPFEGELRVLAYDIEDIGYGTGNDLYTKSGYIEFELMDAPEDIALKYRRSYYKWFENNTLYLNNETGTWDSQEVYSQHFENNVTSGFWFSFLDYWDYILVLIFLYFVVSVFINNKRIKDSVKLQHEAVSSIEITMAQQNKAMELHEQTNQILLDILKELKARKS